MFVYNRKSGRQTRRQHKPWWIRNWSYKRKDPRENRCILNDLRIEGRQEFKGAVGMPEVQILTCATFTDLVQPSLPHLVCGFETACHHIQMPYDRSIVSSKPSSLECAGQARASSCRFQYLLDSFTHPVCAYIYFLVLPSFLYLLQQRDLEGSSYAVCVQSWHSSYVWYSPFPYL